MDSNLQPKPINNLPEESTPEVNVVETKPIDVKEVNTKAPEKQEFNLIKELKNPLPNYEQLFNGLIDQTPDGSKLNNFLTEQRDAYLQREEKAKVNQKAFRAEQEKIMSKDPVSQVLRGLINGRLQSFNELFELGEDTLNTILGNDLKVNSDLIDLKELGTEIEGDQEKPLYFIPKAITQYVVPTAMIRNRLKVLGLKRFQGLAAAGIVDFALTDPYEDNAFNLISQGLGSDTVNNMVEYLKSTPVDTAFKLKTGVGVEKFVDATKGVSDLMAAPDKPEDNKVSAIDKHFLRLKNGIHAYMFDRAIVGTIKVGGESIEAAKKIAKNTGIGEKLSTTASNVTGLFGEKLDDVTGFIINSFKEIKSDPKRRAILLKRLQNYQKATNSDVLADEQAMNEMEFIETLKKFKKKELTNRKRRAKKKQLEKIVGSDKQKTIIPLDSDGDIIDPFGYKRTFFAGQFKTHGDIVDFLNARTKQIIDDAREGGINRTRGSGKKPPRKSTIAQLSMQAEKQLPADTINALSDITEILYEKNLPATLIAAKQIIFESTQSIMRYTDAMDTAAATGNKDLVKRLLTEYKKEQAVHDSLINLKRQTDSVLGLSLRTLKEKPLIPSVDKGKGIDAYLKYGDKIKQVSVEAKEVTKEVDKFISPITKYKIDDLIKMAEDGDFRTLRPILRKINLAAANPKAYEKLVKNGFRQGFFQITNEIFINSILSSPVTHQVNMLATGLNSLSRPLNLALGSVKLDMKGQGSIGLIDIDNVGLVRATKEAIYALQAIGDSFELARKSFKYDTNILDRGSQVVDFERASLEGTHGLIRSVAAFYRLPSRFLMAEDEFFKQLNFRAFAKAEIWEEGTRAGKKGVELQKFMDRRFKQITDVLMNESKTGKYSKKTLDLYKRAREFAAQSTFTEQLSQGSLSKGVQDLVNNQPYLRQILPFIRTPVNIIKQTAQMTPFLKQLGEVPIAGNALKNAKWYQEHVAEMTSDNLAIAARAKGKAKLGGMLWISAGMLAMNHNKPDAGVAITGGGSPNFQIKKQMMDTGWQPYSFRFLISEQESQKYSKTGKAYEVIDIDQDTKYVRGADGKLKYKYVSYKRLDPWANFFSLAADITQIRGYLDPEDPRGDQLADVAKVAMARNIVEKSYLQGITEVVEMFDRPDGLQRFLARRLAAVTMPVSSLGRDVKKALNTYSSFSDGNVLMDKRAYGNEGNIFQSNPILSVRQYFNEIATSIPFYNAELRPEQNWITGQYRTYPVGFGKHNWNVLLDGWSTETQTINDPVLSVIADTNTEFQPPEVTVLGGEYQLNTDEYAQLVYLTASTKIGGKRLYDKLLEEINKPQMQKDIRIMRGEFITPVNEEVAVTAQVDARKAVVAKLKFITSLYKKKAKDNLIENYLDPNKKNRIKTVQNESDKIRKGVSLDFIPQVPF